MTRGSYVSLTGQLRTQHTREFWIFVIAMKKIPTSSEIFLHSMRCIEHKKDVAKRVAEYNAKIAVGGMSNSGTQGGNPDPAGVHPALAQHRSWSNRGWTG
ncbi:unnamed protein product [Amoebophrya sp. A25]|nr:unnamed protein product [Amoebophrya sp. A25]|eukprot:GSA25T00014222001.1